MGELTGDKEKRPSLSGALAPSLSLRTLLLLLLPSSGKMIGLGLLDGISRLSVRAFPVEGLNMKQTLQQENEIFFMFVGQAKKRNSSFSIIFPLR